MNCLSYISSAATTFTRNSGVALRGSFYGFSIIAWRRGVRDGSFNAIRLNSIFTGFGVQCFSTRRALGSRSLKEESQPPMEEDKNAFYAVRKGDVVGIYKSLSDCQAQVSSSCVGFLSSFTTTAYILNLSWNLNERVCDPSVRVYKGHTLHKETEEYLSSRGLKDALYSMHASDLKEDLFGTLVPCPFQQPDGLAFLVDKSDKKTASKKRSNEMAKSLDDFAYISASTQQSKQPKLEDPIMAQPISSKYMTCILEFDGASKGNPGKAGAGAILKTSDGSVVARVGEGLGIATNNVAEYRGLILGMKHALKKGFKQIQVQGDSKLICMQVQDLWQTKNQNMADLCKEVKRLKQMFMSFKISHVLREFNSGADNEANLAINLQAGEVYEESAEFY